tara:strand:+ start:940 stop:2187 length:1248 start_codon:yes stop_codon:yes gene_type:complete
MKKIYKKIKFCRICGNKNLLNLFDLNNQYIQGSFVKKNSPSTYQKKIPLKLVLCKNCSLVQLQHTTNKEILYKNYWYESGVNETMRNHLKNIVNIVCKIKNKKKLINALDIGCNDGTLLNFYPKNVNRYGLDPSQIITKIKDKNINTFRDYFPPKKNRFRNLKIKFDIITSIAMFYDLDNPNLFVKKIKSYLKNDGVWVFELSYLLDMLKLNSFDTICHEHLEYYSIYSLDYLMNKNGLKIFDVTRNKINGGSIRCFVTHKNYKFFDKKNLYIKLKKLKEYEKRIKIKTIKPYKKFFKKIVILKNKMKILLEKIKKQNKTIHIYGASTKGNTILQWYDIDNSNIKYAADRNKEKWGAHTIGSKINIISEKKSKSMKPDYYLVLPWHFKKEFLKREKKFLHSGRKMIFPLPNIKIY